MDAGRGQHDVEEEDVVLCVMKQTSWAKTDHAIMYVRMYAGMRCAPLTLAVSLVALAVSPGWLRYRTRSIVTWNDWRGVG